MKTNWNHKNDDLLETRLRDGLSPLPDAGFSHQVLAALPPRAPAHRPGRRPAFVAAGALSGLACVALAGGSETTADPEALVVSLNRTLAAFADPMLLSALIIACLSLVYAFRSGVPRRPTI